MKSHKTKGAAWLPLVLLLAGCASEPVVRELDLERQELMETDRAWSEAASGTDIEALLAYWTDDAVIYPAGQPAVVGKPAIRRFLEANRQIPGFAIRWEPSEAHVSEGADMGYTLGVTRIALSDGAGGTIENVGKYTVVWRKVDGQWKCVVDMFNFDKPAAPPVE